MIMIVSWDLPNKHPCTIFHGVNVAASIQQFISWVGAHVGQNHEVYLSTPWDTRKMIMSYSN